MGWPVGRRSARALVATGALVVAVLAGPGSLAATGGPRTADGAGRGQWSLAHEPAGPRLVWRSDDDLPVLDSRPEFRVGTRLLGRPHVGDDGRTLSLPLAALRGAAPSDVEVWMGARRLDATPETQPSLGDATSSRLRASAVAPRRDPGTPGSFETESFDYSAPDFPWQSFDAPMEVLGHAVLPVGVDRAPLVVFLHGRHIACYGIDDPGFWPCAPGSQPVPSYLGYTYLQQRLAGQGYATVSISANAVNAQDGNTNDGGSRARGALVRRHLSLLAGWAGDAGNAQWGGRLDLDQVVLVGHSRGGEGVNQAAIDTAPGAPYRLAGQILLAPTDFGYQTAPYLPTEVLLGYCDGDVLDLQGQRYVDAAPLLAPDDPTLRSSVLLLGANHNFFNTEWTPGLSAAPSEDDWWDGSDPVCGRGTSDTRLTAGQQRRAAITLVAAGVHAFTGREAAAALDYLDSGDPVALPDAGPAVALTHALGGRHETVRLDDGVTAAGAAQPCRSGQPAADAWARLAAELCGVADFHRQPHWTPAATFPASVHAAYAASGLPAQLALTWTTPGAQGGLALSPSLDLEEAGSALDLRVVVDPRAGPVSVQVVLGAGGTSWAGPTRTLTGLPGSEWLAAFWSQTVRVDPDDYRGRLDLSRVDTVELRAISDSGRVWVLDASKRLPGLSAVPSRTLPRVRLGRVVQPEGGAASGGVALVPFDVVGVVEGPARLAVAADGSTWSETRRPQFTTVDLAPGQTSGTIPIRFQADDLDDLPRQVQLVHAVARHGLVTSGFVGHVVVRDDDASPEVTFAPARRTRHYGDDLRFLLRLSAPVDYYVVNVVRAVRSPWLPALRTSDVPRRWLVAQVGDAPDDVPLAQVWRFGFLELPPGSTRSGVTVPTRRQPLHERAASLRLRFSAQHLTGPLFATVRVLLRP
jgi:hypothetical protein